MCRPEHVKSPSAYLLNDGIRRTLKTNKFDGRGLLRSFSTPSLPVCRVDVFPTHKISYNVRKILNDRSHVLFLPTRNRFQAIIDGRYDEHYEGLWMNYVVNTMQRKKTVRSWARRRVEHAIVAALRARGFGRNGRRMVDSDTSSMRESKPNGSRLDVTVGYAPEILIGTVNIQVLPGSIETSFAEVQREANVAVAKILKTCGRYPGHR